MNLRRGFFRLWLVGSMLWVIGVAVVSYDLVASEFKRAAESKAWSEVGLMLLPVHCKDARGASGADYTGREGPWSDHATEGKCMYKMADFRRLYPEYKDLSDNDLVHKAYDRANRTLQADPDPWRMIGQAVAIAVIVPLTVLLFGWVVGWAFAGFHRT